MAQKPVIALSTPIQLNHQSLQDLSYFNLHSLVYFQFNLIVIHQNRMNSQHHINFRIEVDIIN